MKKQFVILSLLVAGAIIIVGGVVFAFRWGRKPAFLERSLDTMAIEAARYVQKERDPSLSDDQLVNSLPDAQGEVANYQDWSQEQKRKCESTCQAVYQREVADRYSATFYEPLYYFHSADQSCRIFFRILESSESAYYEIFNCTTGRIMAQYHKTRREPTAWEQEEYDNFVQQRDELMGLDSR
ncbi:MAG: hypothetical protein Q7S23_02400 [bacterium]|nr:hypothetical protein [bacterium]